MTTLWHQRTYCIMRHKLGFFSGGLREHGEEKWRFMKCEKFLDYQNAPQRGGLLHGVRKILNVSTTNTPPPTITPSVVTAHQEPLVYNLCVYANEQLKISHYYSLIWQLILTPQLEFVKAELSRDTWVEKYIKQTATSRSSSDYRWRHQEDTVGALQRS